MSSILFRLWDFKFYLHEMIFVSRFHPSSWEPCRLCDDTCVHIFITEVSLMSPCSYCWSRPCLPHCLHLSVDNSPPSDWGVVLHFSCNLLLVSARCLTSWRHMSCHLHFTFTNPFSPVRLKPPVPQVIYHPVSTTHPHPLSCSKSMISN